MSYLVVPRFFCNGVYGLVSLAGAGYGLLHLYGIEDFARAA